MVANPEPFAFKPWPGLAGREAELTFWHPSLSSLGSTTTLHLLKLQLKSLHPHFQALGIDQHHLALLAKLGQEYNPARLAIVSRHHTRREGGLVPDKVDLRSEGENERVSVRERVAPCSRKRKPSRVEIQ